MRSAHQITILLVSTILLVGCVTNPTPQDPSVATNTDSASERPVVLAIMDSELNYYHDSFQSPLDWNPLLKHVPDATLVRISAQPDYETAAEADEANLSNFEKGRVVAFDGTRLMGVSMIGDASNILKGAQHGTSTTYTAYSNAPDVVIVFVQIGIDGCSFTEACTISPSIADGMEWIANQSWIDVVSLSLGLRANGPDSPELHEQMARFIQASKRAHESGKVIFNAAGNDPTLSVTDYTSGLPWVICVGGFQPEPRGEEADASKMVDVVSNYTVYAAEGGSRDAYGWHAGTSYAAPLAAGTMAQAMSIYRSKNGEEPVPVQAWRNALNASATQYGPTDWTPTTFPANDTWTNVVNPNIPVLFAPSQMGWGYVGGNHSVDIAKRVLEGDFSIPSTKHPATQAFQDQYQKAREDYWRNFT